MATPILRKTDRYFMQLAYNGLPFHGWQRQPNAMSVQQKLEEAMAMVFREPEVAVTGAGRTDAGVSAAKMIAHFDLPRVTPPQTDCDSEPEELSTPRITPENEPRIIRALNSILAPHIVVYRIWKVASDAHARFDALSRSYRYFAHTRRTPFAGQFSWLAPEWLDFKKMNEAAAVLLETEDFTSFSKLHTDVKTNICHVTHAAWRPQDAPDCEASDCEAADCEARDCEAADCEARDYEAKDCEVSQTSGAADREVGFPGRPTMWVFEITADRFLRNMVRAVVGTLVDVGRGKLTINDFRKIIDRKDRCAAGTSMPPGPLFLHDIRYPDSLLP